MNRVNTLAIILLGILFFLLFASAWDDSAIMDELAHIPAAYSYIMQKDMRLNPEHPPLIKDLAGLPLALLDLNFPTDVKPWQDDLNGQWEMGRIFLYEAGNDPDQILHWARLPMMLLALLFGWILFTWTKRHFGPAVALLTLFLFAFSPTFIAHARYVTTDLAAAFGFLIGIMAFINFIENPSKKNIILAGIAFGIAQLLKFSLFLLLPVYGVMTLLWIVVALTHSEQDLTFGMRVRHALRHGTVLVGKLVLVGLIGLVLVWIVYIWHIWNYPQGRQLADATEILSSFGKRYLVNVDLWLIGHRLTRPIGQYMLGLLMVVQRAAGGNTTYFLGEVSNGGWWYYFPVAYLLKETLALHALTALAIGIAVQEWLRRKRFAPAAWIRTHFAETTMLVFIAIYWGYSIRSPLNIGVRHVLPTFPFIYILVSKQIVAWLHNASVSNPQTFGEVVRELYERHIAPLPRYALLGLLLFWSAVTVLASFPNYLSYYNESVGGSKNGYRFIVDSNYDWGQDLKRLAQFVTVYEIDHIALDYFGGGSPAYYLGPRVEGWWSARGAPHGYFAISASFREGAFGALSPGFENARKEEDSYLWLRRYKPVARAGDSIFIYYLP